MRQDVHKNLNRRIKMDAKEAKKLTENALKKIHGEEKKQKRKFREERKKIISRLKSALSNIQKEMMEAIKSSSSCGYNSVNYTYELDYIGIYRRAIEKYKLTKKDFLPVLKPLLAELQDLGYSIRFVGLEKVKDTYGMADVVLIDVFYILHFKLEW